MCTRAEGPPGGIFMGGHGLERCDREMTRNSKMNTTLEQKKKITSLKRGKLKNKI